MKAIREIKTLALIIIFVLFIILGKIALAADPPKQASDKKHYWINIFPIGTEIHSFAVDPKDANKMYVSTYRGLFISINGGKLWEPLAPFKSGREAENSIIKIDPSSLVLYWGISWGSGRGSLWKSSLGGIEWQDISAGVIKDEIYDIEIHPKIPEIIYVASEGGLYKTFNSGKTWGKIKEKTYSVFLNPEKPDEVYASFKYFKKGRFSFEDETLIGLHRSTDGGQSFNLIESINTYTFKSDSYSRKCGDSGYALLNPSNDQEMLVACGGGRQSIIKSSDGGKTWELIDWGKYVPEALDRKSAHIVGNVIGWSFHPKDKNIIYFVIKMKEDRLHTREWPDKILKSIDGGKTWTSLPSSPQQKIGKLVILSDAIYVATDYGIYKTTDDGKSWESRSFGLPVKMKKHYYADYYDELEWIDTKTGIIYIGSMNGYWISDDKGLNWKREPLLRGFHYRSDDIDPSVNLIQTVITADQTRWELVGKRVSKESWQLIRTMSGQKPTKVETGYLPRYFAVSPSNPRIIYLSVREKNPWTDSFPHGDILLKSEDAGFSWTTINWQRWLQMEQGSYYHDIVFFSVDPTAPNISYMAVTHSIKGMGNPAPSRAFSLLKTTNGGETWADISPGLYKSIESAWASSKWLNPAERPDIANLLVSSPSSLVIDPSNSNIVYITTSAGGAYRSDDGGKTWKPKSPQNYFGTMIKTFDNYSAQQCKGKKGCKVTLDISLARRKRGIIMMAPQNTVIVYPKKVLDEVGLSSNNIAVDPSNSKIIYLATNKGVYRSSDRGDTWQLLDRGLLDRPVRKVIASSSLVLAEGESGIYKLSE